MPEAIAQRLALSAMDDRKTRTQLQIRSRTRNSWRKCHKKAKNVRARFDSNLPSCRNAYKQISELSFGGISVQIMVEISPKRCREANTKREFGLGNLSGKVEMDMFGGLTKTSSRIAIAAALGMTLGGFVMSSTSCQSCGSRRRLLRGSRGAGGRARGDDRPQGQQEGVRDPLWLGGQGR